MNPTRYLLVFAAALAAASLAPAADPEYPRYDTRVPLNFETIFNGRDLTGWTTDAPASVWTVKDGILVGRNTPKREGGNIRSAKSYKNFVLELDVKYRPPGDSGISFRQPSLQMQIGTSHSQWTELTGSFYLGALGYTNDSTAKDTWRFFYPGRWNSIRLEARGSIFTVYINGQQAHRYASTAHPNEAPVSLQVHNNDDLLIEFRNIRIAQLP